MEGTYEISTGTAELISDDYTPDGWVLEINGMESSHVVIGRPRELDFEYMRWLAAVVEAHVDASLDPAKLRITHLGGGACSLARYFADVYPQSRNTVVELDAKLADYVREWFDLPKAPTVKIRVGEARAVTETFAPASRDVIIRDVFAGYVTPTPLTTLEFTQIAAKSLSEKGLYIINCGDNRDLAGARAEAAAIAQVFPHTAAAATRRCSRDVGAATSFWPARSPRYRWPVRTPPRRSPSACSVAACPPSTRTTPGFGISPAARPCAATGRTPWTWPPWIRRCGRVNRHWCEIDNS